MNELWAEWLVLSQQLYFYKWNHSLCYWASKSWIYLWFLHPFHHLPRPTESLSFSCIESPFSGTVNLHGSFYSNTINSLTGLHPLIQSRYLYQSDSIKFSLSTFRRSDYQIQYRFCEWNCGFLMSYLGYCQLCFFVHTFLFK